MIRVHFFGQLREDLKADSVQVDAPTPHCVSELIEHLSAMNADWQPIFTQHETTMLVAVNQEMAEHATPLQSGDEVAFFPPVTGG